MAGLVDTCGVTSAPTSTSLLPPDWSTFVPDTIGAVMTGLAVGAVIVLYERNLDQRRESRSITDAHLRTVETMSQSFTKPFAYDPRTLQPDGTQIDRAAELLRAVPPGAPDVMTPGFTMLRAMVDQHEILPSTAMDLEHALEAHLRDRPHVQTALNFVNKHTDFDYLTSMPVPSPMTRHPFHDPDVRAALQRYLDNRSLLNAAREAFIASDESWRANAWTIVLDEVKGAPHNPVKKIYRAWIANRRRAEAREEAEEAGLTIMQNAGPVWIPPRGW